MNMKASKKASINSATVTTWVAVIIGVVVLFQVIAALFPTLLTAGNTLNESGFPLGSLFVTGGAIWYVMAAGLIYLIFRAFASKK